MAERNDDSRNSGTDGADLNAPARSDVEKSERDSDNWVDLSLSGLMDDELKREPAVEEFMAEAAEANVADAETIADVKDKPGPYISFQHVHKSFGDFVVLNDVSFCVEAGETLCILGRSGVGKSVSLQMLMGFLKPDRGKILVAG